MTTTFKAMDYYHWARNNDRHLAQREAQVIVHERERVIIVRLPYVRATAFWGAVRASNQWADAQARRVDPNARVTERGRYTRQSPLGVTLRRYTY